MTAVMDSPGSPQYAAVRVRVSDAVSYVLLSTCVPFALYTAASNRVSQRVDAR
jgi:hypothetical protein